MNDEQYYKDKKQVWLDKEAKYTKDEIVEMRKHAFRLLSEHIASNCKRYPKMPTDVVEKWTITKRMWSTMYLGHITATIKSLENVIESLQNLTPTGEKAWGKEDVISFIWNDLDVSKVHLKTALTYIKLGTYTKE